MKLNSRNTTILLPFLAATMLTLPAANAFQLFEGDGFDTWTEEGTAFGKGPTGPAVKGMNGKFSGFGGDLFVASGHGGDEATGSLTSSGFRMEKRFIHFLIAGGNHPDTCAVQLLVDGKPVMQATGADGLVFRKVSWDVSKLAGKSAQIRISDTETGRWGVIAADHFIFSDKPDFDLPKPAAKPTAELVATPLIAGNNIPKGTSLAVFADHQSHKVTSPTAIAFDEAGDLYVAETHRFRFGVMDDRNHPYWYLDDLAATTTADRRALHEKWKAKVSLESMTAKSELIRKLGDRDGDGKADFMAVFADGFNDVLDGTAAGIFSHQGKTYFACIPKIHVLEDGDGDGKADKRSVVADGFGVHISLSGHDMNGFALGNDGRIYGTIGDRGFNITTKEGAKYVHPNEGAIFRFEPDGSGFEVVHTGLRNPKEIAFDEYGNGITVDNNSDQGDPSRIVYIMEGVDSGWRINHQALHTFRGQIGLDEKPISPWMTERMADTRNPEQPAFIVPPIGNLSNGPSGLTYHPGTGFLGNERGRFLLCDYKGSAAASLIWSIKVSPEGAGMKYDEAYRFNTGVTATDVEYGYDGRLYVADFMGGWQSHEDGRIYTLTADSEPYSGLTPDVAQIIRKGFSESTNAELAALLGHPDQRIRMRAHIALASRKDGTATLLAATKSDALLTRLHGVWGLGIRARKEGDAAAKDTLLALASDADSEVRAQAAQILGEVSGVSPATLIPMLKDESLRVRAFAAIALGRLKSPEGFLPAIELIKENADKDLYLRHAGIMALLGSAGAEKLVSLAGHNSPAVRIAAVVALRKLKSPGIAIFLKDRESSIADEAIRAIHDERINEARPAVAALLDGYAPGKSGRELKPMVCRRIIHTAFRLGGQENAKRLVEAAHSPSLELDQRLEILRVLGQWATPFPVDQSIGLWDPLDPRDPAKIAPIMESSLPDLLAGDPELLAPTLVLVEKGHLDMKALPEPLLLRIVTTVSVPDLARNTALHLWLENKPATASSQLVALAADPSDAVATEALAILAGRDPEKALEGSVAALKGTSIPRRQAAWGIIGKIPGEKSAQIITAALRKLAAPDAERGAQIELLEAAASRPGASVKEALAAFGKSLDPNDPLAAWQGALDGGDTARGENLFYNHGTAQCMRCHKIGMGGHGDGSEVGPNLAGIGKRHDNRYLLESMIVPGTAVAPGFGIISLTLNNGKTIGGILNAETAGHYDITVGTDAWRVAKTDVKEATQPVSGMPPMTGLVNIREARDLVAFLASLKAPLQNQPKKPTPKPLDPSKL